MMALKRLHIILTILPMVLVLTSQSIAQAKDVISQVSIANELYHEKNYKEAAKIFESLINQGEMNGYIYYNLGNTYMRLGNKGNAILNYVRAKSLLPRDENLDANLRYAISQTQDQLPLPNGGLVSEIFFWIDSITLIEHFKLLIFFNIIFWFICIGSLYFRKPSWESLKKSFMTILILTFISTWMKYYLSSNQRVGVITDRKVDVKSDRNNQNVTLFELHEGAIITVGQQDGEWAHILIDKDKTGWVKTKSINS